MKNSCKTALEDFHLVRLNVVGPISNAIELDLFQEPHVNHEKNASSILSSEPIEIQEGASFYSMLFVILSNGNEVLLSGVGVLKISVSGMSSLIPMLMLPSWARVLQQSSAHQD